MCPLLAASATFVIGGDVDFIWQISEELALFSIFDEVDEDNSGYLSRQEMAVLHKRTRFVAIISHMVGKPQCGLFEKIDADGVSHAASPLSPFVRHGLRLDLLRISSPNSFRAAC